MTHLETLRVPFEVKSADSRAMTFEGLLSTYSVDLGDDRVMPGAFKRSLDHWKGSNRRRPIPLIDQHQYDSVNRVVGKLADAEERPEGLWTRWEMIPDDEEAAKVYRRLKGGFIDEMSMGYVTHRHDYTEEKAADGRTKRVRRLHEVGLKEGSTVIWAMQPEALIDAGSIKSLIDAARAGTLTDEQKAELRALLDAPPADTPPASEQAAPPAPAPTGLAPDDPKRLAAEAKLREITLRRLATR